MSKNFIRDISHLKELPTIKFLNISYNKIDDISSLEYLEDLEILQAENNEIFSISSLNRCGKIQIVEIASNKIKFESSTYKTMQHLKNVKELTINNNPFLNEIFGYRHLFINKYPNIIKLDNESVSDLDREIAYKFSHENNLIDKIRPITAVTSSDKVETMMNRTVNNKLISQIEYKSDKKTHPLKMIKKDLLFKMNNITDIDDLHRQLEDIRTENKNLAGKNKIYEMEIQALKIELENSQNLNREYEKIIDQKKNNISISSRDDEDKKKLRNEVEIWKKEYCDLLDKSMSTNVSTSRLLSTGEKFRPLSSRPIIKQPKHLKNNTSYNYDYEKTIEDLSNFKNETLILKRKNSLDDSLNNSGSDKNELNDDDDEIDELLRKSVTNLSQLKSEIKYLLLIF